ncbi:MAG TPA: spermidine synthase [Clostridiales bacterium]|nr:MAG: hypothetical protein A2Y22_06640 [Clostridiales bacterium GWD2_32_59]HAN09881.1 spermidine synthase [Clostridiales bacterium]
MDIKNNFLYVVVFICGAMVMILELVAARIIAPFVGTSSYVWTSLIGVILGSMSFGYWLGGKLSDKNPKQSTLAIIIFSAAFCIGITTFINLFVMQSVVSYINDMRVAAILSTLFLFAIPSILLGMVSPYAVKLSMVDVEKSGSIVGNLYALSTVGSIVGTFLAGFVLIPCLGSERILLLITIILILTSSILYLKTNYKINTILIIILIPMIMLPTPSTLIFAEANIIDANTEYSRIWIYPTKHNNKDIKIMQIGNEYSSGMNINDDELAFEYTKYYRLAEHFSPNFRKALMIGGAAYSYPKYYIKKYQDAMLDVVEIDPQVTELARKYFNLKDDPRLRIFHEDGRIFLNNTKNKYDVIYGDAFRAKSVPYHLTTKEATEKMYNALTDNGVAIINLISPIEGAKGKFLRSELATYKSIFPQVYLFLVEDVNNGLMNQNIMLVALKTNDVKEFNSEDDELNSFLKHLYKKEITNDVPILTDDFSPVEYYTMENN